MIHKTNKIVLLIVIVLTFFSLFQSPVYADNSIKDNHDVYHQIKEEKEEKEETTWVGDAFAAAKAFLSESSTEMPEEGELILYNAKVIVRGVNRILWVLLAGISAISLSIVGIRYILGINTPSERGKAKDALHATIRGMAIGFSAILIFNIVMIIVRLIIDSMGSV